MLRYKSLIFLLLFYCLGALTLFADSFKFMTFNIMAWPYFQIGDQPMNLHGLRNDAIDDFKTIDELAKAPITKNIVPKEEVNRRLARVRALILKENPDLVFLQEYTYKTEDQKKRLSEAKALEMADNWEEEIEHAGYRLRTDQQRLVGFKCIDSKNLGTFKRPRYKRSKQEDATAVYFNPARFKLLDAESGCFMTEFEENEKPTKGTYGSGSAYNLVLLEDKNTGKRIFGINLHVKVHTWGQEDLVKTYKEVEKYARAFVDKNNISGEEHVILAGDLNAGRYTFKEQDTKVAKDFERWMATPESTKKINYHNFLGFLHEVTKSGILGFKLAEIDTPRPTSVDCESGHADDIDHIFISKNLNMKRSFNGAALFDILRIPCQNPNWGSASIEAIKKALPSALKQSRYLEFINFNNRLRNEDKVYSDHWPKIVELEYVGR